MHLAPLIRDLAVILGVAGLVTLIFRLIRQPVVLGYLAAGIIVGPYTPPHGLVSDLPNIRVWAELGVIFLMFSLGLEFSFRKLARVGSSASITAVVEVIFMLSVGYATGRLLGWGVTDSLFLGAMLSISSTTIIIKALDEFGLTRRRFAELVMGVLIVEDLVAILLLVALTTIATSNTISGLVLLGSAGKLVLVVGSWFLVGYFLLPRFMRYAGRVGSDEMLTVLSVGLCLLLVAVAGSFQYSVALGSFIMGSILAESTEAHRIESLMKPLRDIFGAVFFVSVGMLIDPTQILHHLGPIAWITGVTIVGKILSTGLGSLLTGQSIKTSTRVGFSLAQIGEFSFIIAALGLSLKVTSDFVYPIGVAVSLITTFLTPYLIRLSEPLAVRLEETLPRRVTDFVARYSTWTERRRADRGHRAEFYRQGFKWLLNALAVTLVFVLVSEVMTPIIGRRVSADAWQTTVGWVLAILGSAPFIWGMWMLFKRSGGNALPLFSARLVTLLWIGALSLEFFAARYVAVGAAILLTLLFAFFFRQLETSYHWLEGQFLSTFEGKDLDQKRATPALAPWDAHLIRLKVHPNASYSGKRLEELQLRNRMGINVVAVNRGEDTIIPPGPKELLSPHDELWVLGTDEQIEKARPFIESLSPDRTKARPHSAYELRNVLVGEGSVKVGTTIRSAGMRERFKCIVVGVERDARRIINPDSDLEIRAGDILWIVGDAESFQLLSEALKPASDPLPT